MHHHDGVSRASQPPVFEYSSPIDFGRDVCGDLHTAESREWLVTNGIGGYGCGTIAGHTTRCYHGLLVAALRAPLGRTLLVAKLDEIAEYAGQRFELATNRWADGTIAPQGFRYIERFHLEGTTPVWTFALADALLEKRVFMAQGANTAYVLYRLVRANGPIHISLKALVDYSGEHRTTVAGNWPMNIARVERGLRVTAFDGAVPCYLLSETASAKPAHTWYRNFDLAVERDRGLPDRTDHLFAGEFSATLAPGDSLTLVSSTGAAPLLDGDAALALRHQEERSLLIQFSAAHGSLALNAPAAVHQLVLAANQFVAARPRADQPDARTVMAGYPWFGDWARDTLIALPGLALVPGQTALARNILRSYAGYVNRGMLPNQIPSGEQIPEYNSVDAALWYVHAVRTYFEETKDVSLLREVFPVLEEIVDSHVRGTRYNIRVDPKDGLLYAGEDGVQLTWMDAKVGNRVVTPRIGKPVEINALWLNLVSTMGLFAHALGRNATSYEAQAQKARSGFARFWNPATRFCFDVLDGPQGNDAALRPNQILAVSLPESPLDRQQQQLVVDICGRELLSSFGLRSLGPREPGYCGRYAGGPQERDAAYHQGTVWGWLHGPFACAHLRVYNDPGAAASLLHPMLQHVAAAGLGTASEIFDGDPPFTPNGCIAQAWTVGEILRAWLSVAVAESRSDSTQTRSARSG